MSNIATALFSKLTLNDGHVMPLFGLGVYRTSETENAVLSTIKNGYRLIDTAEFYENETEVGRAVKRSGVPRGELFVVTKLWDKGANVCKEHFNASLKKLDMDYVDLYLIHSPAGGRNVETYKTMMEFQQQGLIRSIGVSNFHVHHLQGLIDAGLPLPVLNQIELHPWQQKQDIVKFCREKGIAVMGYCPLSRGNFIDNVQLSDMAKRNSKTSAQILIRWCVQNGYITIPKSSNEARIVENAQVFDWCLSEEDMIMLNGFSQKSCTLPWKPSEGPWEG